MGSIDSMVMTAVVDVMESMYGDPVSVNASWTFTDSGYPTANIQSVRLASPHPIYAGFNDSVSLVMRGDSGSVVAPIQLDVSVQIPVIVMKRSVAPGSIVRAEDVEVSMFSVNEAPSNVIRSKQAIVGKKARSRLLEGRMATGPMLYDAAVVTSGQRVRVVLESDAIQIATRGTLRHDARIGERVGVELENGTTVEAEVRDDQTVIIRN